MPGQARPGHLEEETCSAEMTMSSAHYCMIYKITLELKTSFA